MLARWYMFCHNIWICNNTYTKCAVYKTIRIIYNLECSFQVRTLSLCAPYCVTISTSSSIVDGLSCKKLTECLVYIAKNMSRSLKNVQKYSQNVFCYFLLLWRVPNRGEFSVFSSVGRGNLENCSEPRRSFYTVLCRKYEGFFLHSTAWNLTWFNGSCEPFSYLWCLITGS